jgi:UDP-N-acetylglucosamine acyltransferase
LIAPILFYDRSMNIHPTAIVDPSAQLGQHVEIGPYAVIESDVTLGDNCRISAHVVIRRYVTMGPNCRVHPGAVIGDTPQDLAFKETDPSYVRIGAGCVFREFVTIHRGTKPETATEIGNGCYFMACSHAAHNVRVGDNVILANGALLGGYAEIGERAFLSGNVAVHQFCRVGRLAMMGGNSATSKDVPPFCWCRD